MSIIRKTGKYRNMRTFQLKSLDILTLQKHKTSENR